MPDPEANFAIESAAAEAFLRDRYGTAIGIAVTPSGAGSWSRCFAFELDGEARILKLSPHLDDLTCDRRAAAFARPMLPVPQVVDHGEALGMHFTVAERIPGNPLEVSAADEWLDVIPSLANALDVMRTDFRDHGSGWGSWAADPEGEHRSWRDFLLGSLVDIPGGRVSGWNAKLDSVPLARQTFDRAVMLIDQLAVDEVPRGLLHCDLLYRNAHVHERQLAGVFDWGCSIYGDPLMELGWFEFWNPWYPQLDVAPLIAEMARRSDEVDPRLHRDRWLTVLLWIGATHLAYQAFVDRWDDVEKTARRMHELATRFGVTF